MLETANILLSIINTIGISSIITHIIVSWINSRREFNRIKRAIIMELTINLNLLQEIKQKAEGHIYPMPLLKDVAWNILLSSPQLTKFGGDQSDDPIILLSDIYTTISVLNQMIRDRNILPFSAFRAASIYTETLETFDKSIEENAAKLIHSIKRALDKLKDSESKVSVNKNKGR